MKTELNDATRLLVDVPAAGAALDLSRSKVYELIAAGQLEAVKIGKRRLIPWACLEDFVARVRSGELVL